jgi:hypothetical protein
MVRVALITVWVCAVVAASAAGWIMNKDFANDSSRLAKSKSSGNKRTTVQARQVSVPVFNRGVLDGYFVLRFSIISSGGVPTSTSVRVEDIAVDEAIRHLPTVSVQDVQKGAQPAALAKSVIDGVNLRTGQQSIDDIVFNEFTYVAAKDARR